MRWQGLLPGREVRTWEVTVNGPKWMAGMIGFIYSYREIIMRDAGDKGFWPLFCTGRGGGTSDMKKGPKMRYNMVAPDCEICKRESGKIQG